MMDRPIQKKRSLKKAYITGAIVLVLVFAGYWVLSDASSSRMDRDSVQIKSVQKGPFSVYVVGNGTVVPRDIDYILPKADGELVAVNVESGDSVKKGETLFVIRNEELMVEFGNKEITLAEAKAALDAKVFELETQKLQLQMGMLQAKSAYSVQAEEYEANKILMAKDNPPISGLKFRQSEIQAIQLKQVYELELTRINNFEASMQSQLHQYELRVSLAENMLARIRDRVEDLNLKAKRDGVIQDVDLKPGQRVELGTVIGLVSNPDEVYVRLKVSAVQGHRLGLGQTAIISIRGEDKTGKVIRVDPNVRGTTIDVDVELDNDAELRSNMFVSGKIVVEELAEALFVEAPSGTIENGTSSFYRVSEDGRHVQLTKVETGLLSAGRVQIRSGLFTGDDIVVSDTGKFNGAERVALY